MLFIICSGVVIVTIWLYFRNIYSRFSRYGVNTIAPVPLLGNCDTLAFNKSHIAEDYQTLYDAFPKDRFLGRFELTRPVIMIRSLDLVKRIAVKDFNCFLDHRSMVDERVDPLFGRNLFSLKGQEWKDMRTTLSPAFTSSKMRAMIPFLVEVSQQLTKILREMLEHSESGYIDIDSKDLTTRYTNDVIASCGFGLKLDSLTDSENEFYMSAKTTAHFGFRRILVYLGYASFPSVMKKLNIKFLSESSNDYFKNLFLNAIQESKVSKICRPDMIHLLSEANKATSQWSNTDLIAQALLFFIAGFETVSSAMCFLLYELAVNPDVQDRLVNELKQNEDSNKSLDYDGIHDLKYLDMVVSELFRKWPVTVGMDRICTKKYNMGKPNDIATEDFIVHEGEYILIPIWAIHRDPEYYPDPEKFDPERFSYENRVHIKAHSYLPFGTGPRNCIGSRFALFEIKVMIYHLLLQFQVLPAEMTRIPAELKRSDFILTMEGGHWIRFKVRV